MPWKVRGVRRHLAAALASASVIGTVALAAQPPPDDLWAFAAEERPDGRPPLTRHRDVAGLLGAMLPGDAALMSRDRPRFQTLPVEQLLALRVTFAARDAQLAAVARLFSRGWFRGRLLFVPRSPGDPLTLTLRDVRLEEVVAALSRLGEVQVREPGAGPSRGPSGDAPEGKQDPSAAKRTAGDGAPPRASPRRPSRRTSVVSSRSPPRSNPGSAGSIPPSFVRLPGCIANRTGSSSHEGVVGLGRGGFAHRACQRRFMIGEQPSCYQGGQPNA